MPMDFAASIGDEIDGRPLHLYRLSERRFDELEIGLRSGLGRSRDGETAAASVLWAAECVFWGHPATDSESIRPPIPILSGHRFRSIRPPL